MAGRSRTTEEEHQHLHQQKRDTKPHHLLPSPPRPAGEAKAEKRTRRRTFTTSPATKTKSERGKEGKDQKPHSDAIAAVFDVVGRHTHLYKGPIYTHAR
jgi:hypothetical protein